jgi:hypothetical protein
MARGDIRSTQQQVAVAINTARSRDEAFARVTWGTRGRQHTAAGRAAGALLSKRRAARNKLPTPH